MRHCARWGDTVRRANLLPRCCPDRSKRCRGKILTDRFINSRKKASPGKRDDYPDAIVPGLALRVTDRGHKSFVLVTRYPSNPEHPTRRALGDVGAITLEQARQKARGWLELIGRGIDPKIEEARQRAEAQRRQLNSFAAVAAEFLDRHASGLKKSAEAKRIIEAEFVKRWGPRPITDIMPEEAAAAIRAIVKRGAPYQAHNAFGYLRRLFNWAIGTHRIWDRGVTGRAAEPEGPDRQARGPRADALRMTSCGLCGTQRERWATPTGHIPAADPDRPARA